MSTVLHHFQYTAEFTIFIAHRCVDNIDEQAWFIDPEFRLALFARTELLYDFLYYMNGFCGVTILHLTADNVRTARENTMCRIAVELN